MLEHVNMMRPICNKRNISIKDLLKKHDKIDNKIPLKNLFFVKHCFIILGSVHFETFWDKLSVRKNVTFGLGVRIKEVSYLNPKDSGYIISRRMRNFHSIKTGTDFPPCGFLSVYFTERSTYFCHFAKTSFILSFFTFYKICFAKY